MFNYKGAIVSVKYSKPSEDIANIVKVVVDKRMGIVILKYK